MLLYFFSNYTLLELTYRDMRSKTLAAKELASMGGLSIHETEYHMDMDMFLDGCMKWEAGACINPSSFMKCSYTHS